MPRRDRAWTGAGGGRAHGFDFHREQESCGRGKGPRIRRSKLNLVTLADYELGGAAGDVVSTPRTRPIAKGAKGGIDGRDAWDGG